MSSNLWGCTSSMRRSAVSIAMALALLGLASCRQNMANEPRYRTFQESGFFPNGSSARPLPPGTVPQERELNRQLVSATVDGHPATDFPFPITIQVLQRGQQRFDIFCTPCHDHLGTGQGMAVLRGFRERPPSFHIDRLRAAQPGYFFGLITNGFGVMPSYASQIPVRDRWAIIAYVRALQLSANASTTDVPPDELKKLESGKQ
jgi:mono/diheme cytochrome c family protein